MEEFMFLGLRMTAGVSAAVFEERFGRTLEEVYGNLLRRHMAQGLLEQTEEGFRLTEKGTDVSNYVMSDYLL
jgi:oxygen-independent coproporphyrinogen-3 oxidase